MRTLLINVLIILSGVIVLELIFGDWWVDNQLFLTRIPRNIHINFSVTEIYKGESSIRYTRDEYGLRGTYTSPDEIDILTVGGSTTDQRFIDDELTWQSFIIRSISEAKEIKLKIVNAGVDGQSTFGHIANFQYWFPTIPKLKPKFILFYIGLNDKWSASPHEKYDRSIQPVDARKSATFKKVLLKSAFYNAWLNATGLIVRDENPQHLRLDWNLTPRRIIEPLQKIGESELLQIAAYKSRVGHLIDLTRKMGAEAIVVNQKSMLATHKQEGIEVYIPDGWGSDYLISVARLEKIYAEATFEACREQNAICIDLYRDLEDRLSSKYYYDIDHNNPAGTEFLGKYLANALLEAPRFWQQL